MTKELLAKLREVCRLRTEGKWEAGSCSILVDERQMGCMEYTFDAEFVAVAADYMDPLIDEVTRLRAIAHTLGLIQGMKREELIALIDGDDR